MSHKLPHVDKTFITDMVDCLPWHEVYAWLPVKTINGKYVWLKKIYKRRVWEIWGNGFMMEPVNQYANLFEILEDDSGKSIRG